MEKELITLALVDDHRIVIDGLKSLLEGHPRFKVVLEGTDPAEVLRALENTPADILITDVMMPGMNGAELAKETRKRYPHMKILALSMSGEGKLVNSMIEESDISGYVLKNLGKSALIAALEKISSGGVAFDEEVLQEMLKASENRAKLEAAHLTGREIELIRLIEKEMNNRQIAETLFISERTVETHRKNILRKTGTNSVLSLIKYAYEHHLIQ